MTRTARRPFTGDLAVTAGLAVLATTGTAAADRREASLHAELVGGAVRTGDADGGDATATVPVGGLAVRASYATRDRFQYDVALTLLRSGEGAFPERTFMPVGQPPVTGPFRVGAMAARLDGGVTFRLGVRWIPTVRLAAGVQLRRLGEAVVDSPAGAVVGREPRLALDAVGVAALGLDHRVNRRLIVGASAGGVLAVATDGGVTASLEATVHGAYYWYPRW